MVVIIGVIRSCRAEKPQSLKDGDSALPHCGHTATYQYDNVNRLTSAVATGNWTYNLSFIYTQDGSTGQYGNMTCTTNGQTSGPCPNYSFNASNNHITTSGFTYDAAGDVTADSVHTYQWDAEGRISQIVDSGISITFDAFGRRVYRSTSSAYVSYLLNPQGQLLGGTWTGGGWNAEIPFNGRILAEYSGATTGPVYFDHPNALGSEQQWTGPTGTESNAGELQFYPWGQEGPNTTNGVLFQLYASLQLYDPESDGYQTPNRYLIPRHGRWLTPDPSGEKAVKLEDPQTWNMYAYVRNNPTTLTDPSGLQQHDDGGYSSCAVLATCGEWVSDPSQMPGAAPPIDLISGAIERLVDAIAGAEPAPPPAPTAPGPPALVEYNGHTVTDANVRQALADISVYTASSTVYVTSGDRDVVPPGGARDSAHLTGQAADLHILGMTDTTADNALKSPASPIRNGFRLIQHGPHTITQGAHLHLDSRNQAGRPTGFIHEGMTPLQRGIYSHDQN